MTRNDWKRLDRLSRRDMLRGAGLTAGGLAATSLLPYISAAAQEQAPTLPTFTGPGANPHWNSVGPVVSEPQKAPLILLTDRPVQLETPRNYFMNVLTPNDAFYVRWHLDKLPNAVDLKEWRLRIEGNVASPQSFSMGDLLRKFKPETIVAVNQCSGNSRSRLQPRVPGGQWGNGAMGNARWTGVKLKELLNAAGMKSGSVQVQVQGLDEGEGPEGMGSRAFLKSLDLENPVIEECMVAYAMNGESLPMLNGFPVRLVVPGYFATYWMKCLTWIRVLDKADENFWMKTAYRVPDNPRGTTTPEALKAGGVKTVPMGRMPVRSFLVTPDGSGKIPAGMSVNLRGIAFSGFGKITKIEISEDDGKTWNAGRLGEDFGAYSFRTWEHLWTPKNPGRYSVAVRATDEKGNVQLDEPVWNGSGYMWNKIERQQFVIGAAE